MTESTNKEIYIDGVDTRELYGVNDVYIEQIKTLHPKLKIIARGSTLKVLGAKSDIEDFERKMQGLIAYYNRYGHISKEVISQSFARGISREEQISAESNDVIVYGNNGNIIRARTVNQQKLVELDRICDLIFATGPAGSGKTYTAIALAVRALRNKQVKRVILTRPAV